MNEYALGLDGDAIRTSDVANGERLRALNALNMRLRAQRLSQGCAAEVAQRQGAGKGRLARLVCGGAEDVVEDHRAHPAMDMTRRSFVGGAKNEVRMHHPVRAVVDGQRRGDRIAKPDDDVAPRDRLTVRSVCTPNDPGNSESLNCAVAESIFAVAAAMAAAFTSVRMVASIRRRTEPVSHS